MILLKSFCIFSMKTLILFCQGEVTYQEQVHKRRTCFVEQIVYNIWPTLTKNLIPKGNGNTDSQNFHVSTQEMSSSYELLKQKDMHFFATQCPCPFLLSQPTPTHPLQKISRDLSRKLLRKQNKRYAACCLQVCIMVMMLWFCRHLVVGRSETHHVTWLSFSRKYCLKKNLSIDTNIFHLPFLMIIMLEEREIIVPFSRCLLNRHRSYTVIYCSQILYSQLINKCKLISKINGKWCWKHSPKNEDKQQLVLYVLYILNKNSTTSRWFN